MLQLSRLDDGLQACRDEIMRVEALVVAAQHFDFLRRFEIADFDFEEETVQLRFGERIGAIHLDGVLGGDDEKRVGQPVGIALDADLAFLHRFEQSRLGFRGRAVDLVRQQNLCENWAALQVKLAGLHVKDDCADDIRGHQIRRELDAAILGLNQMGERLRHERFGGSGYAFQQDVTACEQGDQQQFDDIILTD